VPRLGGDAIQRDIVGSTRKAQTGRQDAFEGEAEALGDGQAPYSGYARAEAGRA
jgi:hypothetical protein